jgi:AcrR family transcriptional regulator
MAPKTTLPAVDELRANLRRNQILEAATRVFAEKGYHRATTKDIASEAEIAEGTIYLYFKNKSDLLIALLKHLDRETTQGADLTVGLELSPRALLTKRLEVDLAQLGPNFDLMLAILPEMLADPAMRAQFYKRMVLPGITGLTEHLQARQRRGETNIPNIPMAARIFVSAMLGLELMNILGDELVRDAWKNPADLAEAMAQVLLDGLQPTAR